MRANRLCHAASIAVGSWQLSSLSLQRIRSSQLEVQIFGIKKSADTRKSSPLLLGTKNKNPFRRFVGEAGGPRRAAAIRPEVRCNGFG